MTSPNTVRPMILGVLTNLNGEISGTSRLCRIIPAAERVVKRELQRARAIGLIRSIHSHGGRGKLAMHKLTRKGRRYAQSK